MPRENKCWSCCPQQHSGLSLCGTQLNMAHCPRREEKVGKDRPGTGHSKSITQHCKANKERGQTPPRPAWSMTWRVQTAVQKAMVFKKRRGGGGRRTIYTHACQNRRRTVETTLKCTKILKQYIVHQEQHYRSNTPQKQTHTNTGQICGYQGQSGGGTGGKWSKVQTFS